MQVADAEPHPGAVEIIHQIDVAKITNKQVRRFLNLKREGFNGLKPLKPEVVRSYFGEYSPSAKAYSGIEGSIAESNQLDSPTSLRMSEPNPYWLSQSGQPDDEPTTSEDSVVLSPRKEPRRRFMHKEKGKKKMLGYNTGSEGSDRSKYNSMSRIRMDTTLERTKTDLQ